MTTQDIKKRALLIAFHYPPQAASSGIQRTLSFSKNLDAHNWQPFVLSANPIAYEQKNDSQLSDLPSGLIVKRAFALDSKRHLGIKGRYPEILALPDRWVSWWISAVLAGLSLIRQNKPAVIWSTFPLATAHLIGLTLKKLTGLPWIADFRDPMLQENFPTSRLQRKAYQWIEQKTIRCCDSAVFTTHSALDYYKQRFPVHLHEKFCVIENGFEEDSFDDVNFDLASPVTTRRAPITLLHSGVLYTTGRDPSAFFEAIARLKTQEKLNAECLQVILRAPGELNYFNELAKKYSVTDIVRIEPAIPYRKALAEMVSVDGLLVFQGASFNTQIPAKIYEYFRTRKPVLALVDPKGETARVLRAAGFTSIAQMDSAVEITEKLEGFIAQVQQGTAYVATEEVVTAASRKARARELAKVFNLVLNRGKFRHLTPQD